MQVSSLMKLQNLVILFICLVVISVVVMYRETILFSGSSLTKHILQKIGNYPITLKGQNKRHNIWYDPGNPKDDRILSQLNYTPQHYKKAQEEGIQLKVKRILRYNGFAGHPFYGGNVVPGKKTFEKCPVTRCEVFADRNKSLEMDAIVFEHDHPNRTWQTFPPSQIWVVFTLESPYSPNTFKVSPNVRMNWTATYRRDSTLPLPYYKFITNNSLFIPTNNTNYARGKTKQVAWFVSNCGPYNNRTGYAKELSKYIDVDIYGSCGTKKCNQSGSNNCTDMLRRDYKFYLSFENANCRHYITEKIFHNALLSTPVSYQDHRREGGYQRINAVNRGPVAYAHVFIGSGRHDTLPIVMGASPFDYKMAAPPNSFIHVDDFRSPKELAEYLHRLDKNDTLYNEYFKWKGTGRIVGAGKLGFWCRLCSLLHEQDNRPPSWYTDINEWWRGKDICIGSGYWRDHPGSNNFLKMTPAVLG